MNIASQSRQLILQGTTQKVEKEEGEGHQPSCKISLREIGFVDSDDLIEINYMSTEGISQGIESIVFYHIEQVFYRVMAVLGVKQDLFISGSRAYLHHVENMLSQKQRSEDVDQIAIEELLSNQELQNIRMNSDYDVVTTRVDSTLEPWGKLFCKVLQQLNRHDFTVEISEKTENCLFINEDVPALDIKKTGVVITGSVQSLHVHREREIVFKMDVVSPDSANAKLGGADVTDLDFPVLWRSEVARYSVDVKGNSYEVPLVTFEQVLSDINYLINNMSECDARLRDKFIGRRALLYSMLKNNALNLEGLEYENNKDEFFYGFSPKNISNNRKQRNGFIANSLFCLKENECLLNSESDQPVLAYDVGRSELIKKEFCEGDRLTGEVTNSVNSDDFNCVGFSKEADCVSGVKVDHDVSTIQGGSFQSLPNVSGAGLNDLSCVIGEVLEESIETIKSNESHDDIVPKNKGRRSKRKRRAKEEFKKNIIPVSPQKSLSSSVDSAYRGEVFADQGGLKDFFVYMDLVEKYKATEIIEAKDKVDFVHTRLIKVLVGEIKSRNGNTDLLKSIQKKYLLNVITLEDSVGVESLPPLFHVLRCGFVLKQDDWFFLVREKKVDVDQVVLFRFRGLLMAASLLNFMLYLAIHTKDSGLRKSYSESVCNLLLFGARCDSPFFRIEESPTGELRPSSMAFPLTLAIETGMWDCFRLLVSKGSNVNQPAVGKNYVIYPLFIMVKQYALHFSEVMEGVANTLIECGADVNAVSYIVKQKTKTCETALSVLMCSSDDRNEINELVKLLLISGAHPDKFDSTVMGPSTALELSISNFQLEFLKLLVQYKNDNYTLNVNSYRTLVRSGQASHICLLQYCMEEYFYRVKQACLIWGEQKIRRTINGLESIFRGFFSCLINNGARVSVFLNSTSMEAKIVAIDESYREICDQINEEHGQKYGFTLNRYLLDEFYPTSINENKAPDYI
ncbi:ankyrin repeat domain-containing protein [Endozoicomonas ascidiicola]|uniref:ankyrin repeat domain-containing protein n=1 Tax=Endozoicomonas ascidiicola TaxID=1698521 RepID=UPI00082C13E5|nr:ankyrin repeat domain-containing protein [Endozoicomonas ascidiicola]